MNFVPTTSYTGRQLDERIDMKGSYSYRSEGARMERKAVRAFLRRKLNRPFHNEMTVSEALNDVLSWVLSRQRRYDKKPGGLGK